MDDIVSSKAMERFLPTSREQMDALGWEQPDVVFVSGDAYVDHRPLRQRFWAAGSRITGSGSRSSRSPIGRVFRRGGRSVRPGSSTP